MEMLLRRRNVLTAAAVVLILLGSPLSSRAQRSGTDAERPFDPVLRGQPLCPSRSINYITQTLPQQCLRTDWSRGTDAPTPSPTPAEDNPEVFSSVTSDAQAAIAPTSSESQNSIEPASSISALHSNGGSATDAQLSIVISSSSTTTAPSHSESTGTTAGDGDGDSPLDKANFLSFEEWKRQNLAKAGQSAEHVGTGRAGVGEVEQRRRPNHINHAFDSLGDDTEIEIDFGGFANPGVPAQDVPSLKAATDGGSQSISDQPGEDKKQERMANSHPRGKDAGKTCKERSNYASFDCAATVLKTNPECKGSNSVLVENKDSYMLNECSARNKFFIVELCDDILIDTVVLSNFEFFSSMFRTFKVSVSDRYPVKPDKWRDLGTFEARNSREVQAFLVENPLIWARYIRVEFLTHFGNEYYCPVSLFRVHGTTMMEEFNHEVKSSSSEDDSENEIGEGEEEAKAEPAPSTVTTDALKDSSYPVSGRVSHTDIESPTTSKAVSTNSSQDTQSTVVVPSPEASALSSSPFNSSFHFNMELLFASQVLGSLVCTPEDQETIHAPPTVSGPLQTTHFTESNKIERTTASPSVPSPLPDTTNLISSETSNKSVENSAAAPPDISSSSVQTKTQNSSKSANPASYDSTKSHPSATQPSPANPTTQESFFKSVHKRLQLLESNSTLSLQYIEDQSRILRDAFSAVEKRQLAKTSTFLETLNSTVLKELRDFRNQYDQIWQSTVLELSAQRESSQHEVLALSARISFLADEIVFQKRIAILQFVLILLCLALVIFSRNGSAAHYLELPTLAINRSTSNLSGFGPHFGTPPSTRPSSRYGIFGRGNAHERSPSSPSESLRPSSRYGIFGRGNMHERSPSEESTLNGTKSPDIEYSPPTPTSQSTDSRGNGEEAGEAGEVLSESSDGGGGSRKIHSSPATLGGKESRRRVLEEGGLVPPEPEPEPYHACDG